MKFPALFILFACLLIAGEVKASIESIVYNPDCLAACAEGRSAFIAWCHSMGPGNRCLILANSPPILFNYEACVPYCATSSS